MLTFAILRVIRAKNYRINDAKCTLIHCGICLSPAVEHYIASQSRKLTEQAAPVVIADPLPIAEPPFSKTLMRLGLDFPNIALTAAITFDNVIACREQITPSLLFHELVHAVQYRKLGVRNFAKLYVQGFVKGVSYHDIPLERCAFELEDRFAAGRQPFSVEAEVACWIDHKRF